MMDGITPFYDEDIKKLYDKIFNGEVSFPKGFSENVKSLILGLLDKDPNKRLGSKIIDMIEIEEELMNTLECYNVNHKFIVDIVIGYIANSMDLHEIEIQPFYEDIDFELLYNKQIEPPKSVQKIR